MFRWIQLRLIAPAGLVAVALIVVFSEGSGIWERGLGASAALGALWLWYRGVRSHDIGVRELAAAAENVRSGGTVPALEAEQRGDALGDLSRSLRLASRELRARAHERELERDELRAILGSIEEGLVALDRDLKVLHWNPQATRLFGLDRTPGPGTPIYKLHLHDELLRLARAALETGVVEHTPSPLTVGSEPDAGRVSLSAAPILREGEARGVVLVCRDVTERLRQARIRRDFAANVSHELRTPLALIKGFVETLHDGALTDPEKGPRFLQIVERHVDGLGRLVDDLMTLLTLEGRIEGRAREPIAVCEAVASVLAGFEGRLVQTGRTLRSALPEGLPAVLAHPGNFERAVRNLVENAIKYTEDCGHIEVEAAVVDDRVTIAVRDDGIGIPADDLPHVFTRFYRVDKSRSREQGGTGLGLAIVKHILQAEGGEVRVASAVGEGTTFTIVFPPLDAG